MPAACALDLRALQAWYERANDARGHVVLQRKYVDDIAIIALSPNMRAGLRLNQLTGDAHAIARLANTAFKNVANAEFAADLLDVHRTTFVGEGRIARYDEQ